MTFPPKLAEARRQLEAARPQMDRSSAVTDEILLERLRQVSAEGWTPDHDDRHDDESLIQAAAAYCLMAAELPQSAMGVWPYGWDRKWLKSTDPRRDLVKAGALIVAEIERLDRAAQTVS